jgi:hypothetical protein
MARKTRAELKEIIRRQRETITEYAQVNDALAERVARLTMERNNAIAQTGAVARRCSAALDALDNIATYVHKARGDVAGA